VNRFVACCLLLVCGCSSKVGAVEADCAGADSADVEHPLHDASAPMSTLDAASGALDAPVGARDASCGRAPADDAICQQYVAYRDVTAWSCDADPAGDACLPLSPGLWCCSTKPDPNIDGALSDVLDDAPLCGWTMQHDLDCLTQQGPRYSFAFDCNVDPQCRPTTVGQLTYSCCPKLPFPGMACNRNSAEDVLCAAAAPGSNQSNAWDCMAGPDSCISTSPSGAAHCRLLGTTTYCCDNGAEQCEPPDPDIGDSCINQLSSCAQFGATGEYYLCAGRPEPWIAESCQCAYCSPSDVRSGWCCPSR
jgi:hypothetical protein